MKAQDARMAHKHWHVAIRDTNSVKNEAQSNGRGF